ncbi:hypothetical protein KCP69_04555 [Salmonella enterica subsp. enterica]|nr:hypothetical protein KCP69_04555 [Salmonella enterica subsp. enterica]
MRCYESVCRLVGGSGKTSAPARVTLYGKYIRVCAANVFVGSGAPQTVIRRATLIFALLNLRQQLTNDAEYAPRRHLRNLFGIAFRHFLQQRCASRITLRETPAMKSAPSSGRKRMHQISNRTPATGRANAAPGLIIDFAG